MEIDRLPSTVMSPPAVTLTFSLNRYVPRPGKYVTQFWGN